MAAIGAEMTIASRTVLDLEESLAAAVHRTLEEHRVTQVFEGATGERLALVWEKDCEYTVAGQHRLLTDAQMGRWPR